MTTNIDTSYGKAYFVRDTIKNELWGDTMNIPRQVEILHLAVSFLWKMRGNEFFLGYQGSKQRPLSVLISPLQFPADLAFGDIAEKKKHEWLHKNNWLTWAYSKDSFEAKRAWDLGDGVSIPRMSDVVPHGLLVNVVHATGEIILKECYNRANGMVDSENPEDIDENASDAGCKLIDIMTQRMNNDIPYQKLLELKIASCCEWLYMTGYVMKFVTPEYFESVEEFCIPVDEMFWRTLLKNICLTAQSNI